MSEPIKYKHKMVPVKEWLESHYYLGPESKALRPYWKQQIIDYFEGGRRDFIFTGAMRTGKTYVAILIVLRYMYEISCFQTFPTIFDLSPTTVPKIIFFSFSKGKASSTGISRIIRMIDAIPYFQQPDLKRTDMKSSLVTPYAEVISGSNASHAVGEDVLGAIMDESNVRNVASGNEVQEAQDLFMEIKMRYATTYSVNGITGGFSGIISSSDKATSFTEVEIENALKYKSAFVAQAAVYDVNPAGYSVEKFQVFCGNGDIPAFILGDVEMPIVHQINQSGKSLEQFLIEESASVLNVPTSLINFYQRDISNALKNLSGIAQAGSSTWIKNQTLIDSIFTEEITCPVTLECPNMGIYDSTQAFDWIDTHLMDLLYDGSKVYGHQDISKRNDKTGMGFTFLNDETNKIRSLLYSQVYHNREIDGNEIDQTKIYGITHFLYELGVNFGYLSADSFASDYYLQQTKLLLGKERVGHLSVDETPCTPYLTFLFLMKKKMLELYPYKPFKRELQELEKSQSTGKIDHPKNTDPVNPRFSKDVSDGIIGATYNLYIRENMSEDQISAEAAKAQRVGDGEDSSFFDDVSMDDDDFYSDLFDSSEQEIDVDLIKRRIRETRDRSDQDLVAMEREFLRS